MKRLVWVTLCVAGLSCSAAPPTAPRAGARLSDTTAQRRWDAAVAAGDHAVIGRLASDISTGLWIRALFAEATGDRAATESAMAERAQFLDVVVATARRSNTRALVTYAMLNDADYIRHREAVLWALDRSGHIPDLTVLAARRAYAANPEALARLPCRKGERAGCRRHFDRGVQTREALVAAGKEHDAAAIASAVVEAAASDPLDSWASVLGLLLAEKPRDDRLIFAIASEPEVTANGRVVATAVASREALPSSTPRKLALAHVLIELHDAPDALVIARGVANTSATPAEQEIATTLVAKASLLLGDIAAYTAWRDARDGRGSHSLLMLEAGQRGEGEGTSELARAALVRGIDRDDLTLAKWAVASLDLPRDVRAHAVERIRLDDLTLAAIADTCVRGVNRACDALDDKSPFVSLSLFAEIADAEHVAAWRLPNFDWEESLVDARLPAQLARLAETHHRRDQKVVRARFSRALRDGNLEVAMGMLSDPDTGFTDSDYLGASLLLADVRSGKATSAGARLNQLPGFLNAVVTQADDKAPVRVWSREDARYVRLEGAYRLWGAGKAAEAFAVFRDLVADDLPKRARSELAANAVFAALEAGRRDDAERVLAETPPDPGTLQDDACRGFVAMDVDPARALPYLARAAAALDVPPRVGNAFGYALATTHPKQARAFVRTRLDPYLASDETPPALDDAQMADAVHAWADPKRIAALPARSPMLAYFRGAFQLKLDLSLAKAREDIEGAATRWLERSPPTVAHERAWLLILAGANDKALSLLQETQPTLADRFLHEEATLIAIERLDSATPFDTLTTRLLWSARNEKHDAKNAKRDKKTPPAWSKLKTATAAGEELMCRALMRLSQPRAGAEHCFRAWQQGRKGDRLGAHMSYLVVVESKIAASSLVDGDAVFADGAFVPSSAWLLNKSTWLWRHPGFDTKRVATAYLDGLALNDVESLQQTEWQRAAVAEHYPVLARALAERGNTWRHYVFIVGLLAVGSGDEEVVEIARTALAREMRTRDDPNAAALLSDVRDIVEDDRKHARGDRRTTVESIAAMSLMFGQRVGVEAPRSNAHVALLGAVFRSVRSHSAMQTLQMASDLAREHPTNDTVAVAKALALCDVGRGDDARAYVTGRFPDPTNPRRVELIELMNQVEQARRQSPVRGAVPDTTES